VIAVLEDEIAGWQELLSATDAKPVKKAAAKK
jgi:hypothetical protein